MRWSERGIVRVPSRGRTGTGSGVWLARRMLCYLQTWTFGPSPDRKLVNGKIDVHGHQLPAMCTMEHSTQPCLRPARHRRSTCLRFWPLDTTLALMAQLLL